MAPPPNDVNPPVGDHPASLADTAPLVLFEQRADGTFASIGARILDWTGFPPADWTSAKCRLDDLLPENDDASVSKYTSQGQNETHVHVRTFRVRHAHTGQMRSILEYRVPTVDRAGRISGYQGIWWDLSHEQRQRRRLVLANDSEILMQLTSGFIHDLNNLFLGIASYADLALSEASDAQRWHGYVGHVRENSSRAIEMVRLLSQWLTFKSSSLDLHDLRTIVDDAMEMLRLAVPRRIALKSNTGATPLPVRGCAHSLRQAVCALVLNARDAISERGAIEVDTLLLKPGVQVGPTTDPAPSSPMVCLRIKDSGSGFEASSPDVYLRLHYSTKMGKAGRGIGLDRVRDLAATMGGGLSVSSSPVAGTVVRFWLPVADFSDQEPDLFADAPRPLRFLLAVRQSQESARWKPRLLQAGVATVVATKNPLLLLSENLEPYDAVAFPAESDSDERAWAPVMIRIRAEKFPVRLIALNDDHAASGDDASTSPKTDLTLFDSDPPNVWKEKLRSLLFRPPF